MMIELRVQFDIHYHSVMLECKYLCVVIHTGDLILCYLLTVRGHNQVTQVI